VPLGQSDNVKCGCGAVVCIFLLAGTGFGMLGAVRSWRIILVTCALLWGGVDAFSTKLSFL